MITKFFPISKKASSMLGLLATIFVYLLFGTVICYYLDVTGIAMGLGILLLFVRMLIIVYCITGIVVSILVFLKIL